MTRHRFQDITNCFSFTVPHNGVDAKVSGLLYQCVSVFIIYLIYKTHGKTSDLSLRILTSPVKRT